MYKVVMQHTIQTLLDRGDSIRSISSELGIHRKAVKRLKAQIEGGSASRGYHRDKQLLPHQSTIEGYLSAGLSIQLVWEKLRDHHSVKVSYSCVQRFVHSLKKADSFVPMHSLPGEEGQVDFGYSGFFTLPDGRRVKVWVFCMVLSHSRFSYHEAVLDQSSDTFLRCHQHAFEYFGGAPLDVRLDNLKAGVIAPDFYEPLLQVQYAEFLAHHGAVAKPCRVRTPEHKGKVESGIKYVTRNFFAGLEHREWARLNMDLHTWTVEKCNQRQHGTTKRLPQELFDSVEKGALTALPGLRYEVWHTEQRKVNRLGHVTFRDNYYSLPYQYVARDVTLRTNGTLLRISLGAQELALHALPTGKGNYVTRTEHLPPHKQPLDEAVLRQKCTDIGPFCAMFLDSLFLGNPRHKREKALGLLHLGRLHTPQTLENACRYAQENKLRTLQSLANVCQYNMAQKTGDGPAPADALPPDLGGYRHDLALYDRL